VADEAGGTIVEKRVAALDRIVGVPATPGIDGRNCQQREQGELEGERYPE
jgi:hypothetical protein